MNADFRWLEQLNPEQRQAVETTEGPVLVLSGAGTGKTTVLTCRLRYILQKGLAFPFQCLAVTFTNKAAAEMQERLTYFLGPDAHNIWLGTFHRIGLRILRRHVSKTGLSEGFVILDAADQERLVKQVLADKGVDLKDFPPAAVSEQIQRLKEQALTPEKALNAPAFLREVYADYQSRLKVMNAVDFGDLLLYCVELFQNHPDVLDAFRAQFKYILVDEYQDTNVIQYLWLRLLCGKRNNLCCVGDDDQSIYSWRGAEIGNILRFEKDFPNTTVIRLESNYRSTGHILGAAAGLISHNENRFDKTLRVAPNRDGSGEKVTVAAVYNGDDEAEFICRHIDDEQRRGTPLKEIAVLIRAGFQSRLLEEHLLQNGIPYRMVAGMRFYEREEIRDAVAYIRLLCHPSDDMAFLRIVNKPRRGIGESTIQTFREEARATGVSLTQAAQKLASEGKIKGKAKTELAAFFDILNDLRRDIDERDTDETVRLLLEQTGYMQMRKDDKAPDAQGRLDNLRELLGDLDRFDTPESFLEHVSLIMDNDDAAAAGDCVTVMTLHAAKGLEFDTVFLPCWEEGLFPNQRSMDENGEKGLEEERRLAYVGITRARRKVYISFAGSRRVYNQWQNNIPSRFVSELPAEHICLSNANAGRYFHNDFAFKPYTNADYSYKTDKKNTYPAAKKTTAVRNDAFPVGTIVYHETFGTGKVVGTSGQSIQVVFDGAGLKKVMADYLEKTS